MSFWNAVEPYVLPFFAAAVAVAAIHTFRRGKQARRNWANFAETYGFTYRPPDGPSLFSRRAAVAFQDPGEITGDLEGLPLRLYVAVYGTSKDRRVFTIMSAEIPDLPPGLTIYRENAFLKLTKVLGGQDIATGDPDFDAAFLVKGHDPAGVLNWLNETRRQAILGILGKDSDIDLRDGCLQFQRGQVVGDLGVLEGALTSFKTLIPHLKPQ